jgi:hypothetical protein
MYEQTKTVTDAMLERHSGNAEAQESAACSKSSI